MRHANGISLAAPSGMPTLRRLTNGVTGLGGRKRAFILLRWVLLLAAGALLIFSRGPAHASTKLIVLILGAFASNVALGFVPARSLLSLRLNAAIILADVAWISWGMVLSGAVTADFILLYFLVLFLAAIAENSLAVIGSAVVMGLAYVFFLGDQVSTGGWSLSTAELLRLPFLFAVALFYSFLVEEVKGARLEAELASHAEQARTEFLATVVHDLRVPVHLIGTCADLLAEHGVGAADSASKHEVLDTLQAATAQLRRLVTNFLDFARLHEGRIELRMTPTNLAEVAGRAVEVQLPEARRRGVELRFLPELAIPPLPADADALERVVSNLLANAIDITPAGGRVTVEVACRDEELVLEVGDTGPGIPAGAHAALFRPFSRPARASRAGTGLGLYIVRTLVEAHGGTVSAKNRPEGGAVFIVRFPLAASDQRNARQAARVLRAAANTQPALSA